MASVDPYSPCPCGSGQKFKWCCHKVEAVADRAQRLYSNGQSDLAIAALDEGLRKEPGNAWLLTRKAIYLLGEEKTDQARDALRIVLAKQPKHLGAQILMTRIALETEEPAAGAAQFQRALGALPPEERRTLAVLARLVGLHLSEAGQYPAALKHLALTLQLAGGEDTSTQSGIRVIYQNPAATPWLKNPDALAPAPEGLTDEVRNRFAQAIEWANQGLWSSAAAAFELLSADRGASVEADRNLGLCRLWLADNAGAVEALRRAIARMGATPEAVDLEVLCQQVAPHGPDDLVEHVQLIWPLRDREGLLRALRADKLVNEEGSGPIDEDDPDSPEVDHFGLLDRPETEVTRGLRIDEIPRFVGRVLVGQEIVALDTFDDGRLDGLIERFTTLADETIPPAHPKTKSLGKITRTALAMSWDWLLPAGIEDTEIQRLTREEGVRLVREVWPHTPMPYLRGRTPLQAAAAGDAAVPLRAAVLQLEQSRETWRGIIDFDAYRAMLKIQPEPPIDPETVEIERLHLARLALIPTDRLSDEKLVALYRRARAFSLVPMIEQAARALTARPAAWEPAQLEPVTLYSDLATIASSQDRKTEAFDWIRRGRQAEPTSSRARNAALWDMLEIRIKAQSESPEVWVPDLAVVMDRYLDDQGANQAIMLNLLEMGLLRMVANPDDPEQIMIDSQVLQALMSRYGPRVTTASGELGVSATRGPLWTPGSGSPGTAGGGSGLWTPGSDAPGASSGDKPKLIIRGR
jgi:hypothetical protein